MRTNFDEGLTTYPGCWQRYGQQVPQGGARRIGHASATSTPAVPPLASALAPSALPRPHTILEMRERGGSGERLPRLAATEGPRSLDDSNGARKEAHQATRCATRLNVVESLEWRYRKRVKLCPSTSTLWHDSRPPPSWPN